MNGRKNDRRVTAESKIGRQLMSQNKAIQPRTECTLTQEQIAWNLHLEAKQQRKQQEKS